MGWLNALRETYENQKHLAGLVQEDGTMLLPLSHSTQNAQIQVVIDTEGQFLRAGTVKKEDALTVIPVTEDSATRSSGIAPHPLCDKLCYVAGDYNTYSRGKKEMLPYFEAYIKQLGEWAGYDPENVKVKAVYRYLQKKTLIRDLADYKVITLDDEGKMSSDKIEQIAQEDAFVRFSVECPGAVRYTPQVWKDTALYEAYDAYYQSRIQERGLCYATGEIIPIAAKHPAKIRNTGDKAKLISSNDKIGFTYRGRFTEASEAALLSYEATQKAHSALRWLIEKQGCRIESAYIVSWELACRRIPEVIGYSDDIFNLSALSEEEKRQADVASGYAKRLNKAIAGYQASLDTKARIVVMAVDTADGSGQGRLAITYYNELSGSQFLRNLESWHRDCSWKHNYRKKDDVYYTFYGAPSPTEIALSAYGTDQNGLLKADSKVIKGCVNRILPCIVEGKRFPKDILAAAARNAGRPMSMSRYNWNRILTNTCAMLKKSLIEQKKWRETDKMGVDYGNDERGYLFGRLLAAADWAEGLTYQKEDKNRMTNAIRYWTAFSKQPAKTWKIIYEKLIPYFQKLYPGSRIDFKDLVSEINGKFTKETYSNDPLRESYLLGYYDQYEELRRKSREKKQEETANE